MSLEYDITHVYLTTVEFSPGYDLTHTLFCAFTSICSYFPDVVFLLATQHFGKQHPFQI